MKSIRQLTRFRILLMALVALLVVGMLATIMLIAHPQVPGEFADLNSLLAWIIMGGGAMALSGYVVSYLLENWAFYHNLPMWVKKLIPLALAALIAFAAQAVLALDALTSVPAIIQAIILMAINWLFTQFAYKGIKAVSGYGASTRAAAAVKASKS
jgi:hypothetical protein